MGMTPIFADAPRYLVAVWVHHIAACLSLQTHERLGKEEKGVFQTYVTGGGGASDLHSSDLHYVQMCKGFVAITQSSVLLFW